MTFQFKVTRSNNIGHHLIKMLFSTREDQAIKLKFDLNDDRYSQKKY